VRWGVDAAFVPAAITTSCSARQFRSFANKSASRLWVLFIRGTHLVIDIDSHDENTILLANMAHLVTEEAVRRLSPASFYRRLLRGTKCAENYNN